MTSVYSYWNANSSGYSKSWAYNKFNKKSGWDCGDRGWKKKFNDRDADDRCEGDDDDDQGSSCIRRCDDDGGWKKAWGIKQKAWKFKCQQPEPEPEPNEAPTITAPMSPNVPVTTAQTGVIVDVDAFDPEGDTLIFTLTGEDADRFNIDADTGEIDLRGTMLEMNGSTDGDSFYEVTVEVTDGTEGNVDQMDLIIGFFSGG